MPEFHQIGDLPEENISLLHCPGEHHGLLVVHIVVCCPVHHQIFLVRQLSRLKENNKLFNYLSALKSSIRCKYY